MITSVIMRFQCCHAEMQLFRGVIRLHTLHIRLFKSSEILSEYLRFFLRDRLHQFLTIHFDSCPM